LNPLAKQAATATPPAATSVPPPQVSDEEDQEQLDLVLPSAGLVDKEGSTVPLRGVKADVKIHNYLADVTLSMRFLNQKASPIEATFKFQVEEAVMYGFTVKTPAKTVVGQCKTKEEAQNEYDDAIASGHGAYLLEKVPKRDMFKISVGNLAPAHECIVTVKYLIECDVEGS
jgi:Ca-activated chloride channel family protein